MRLTLTSPSSRFARPTLESEAPAFAIVSWISREDMGFPSLSRPSTPIHDGIVDTLSDFATNLTRYYNLELLAGSPAATERADPIAAWDERVTQPVLAKHYLDRHQRMHEWNALAADRLVGGRALVRHTAETGESLRTVYEASARAGATEFAKRWERMYVLQLARFMANVLSDLGSTPGAQGLDVPGLYEFFAIFRNDDAYFREKKVWSIY